jgi:lipoate-protein ligase A
MEYGKLRRRETDMNRRWRVIDTAPADPFTNMALDEALLREYSAHSAGPTLRIYGWEPAALSLGYSQDARAELDIERCRRLGPDFVRRLTGGGIIAHGSELTYSLVCSREDLGIPERVASSYKIISSFLIEFYRRLGLEASFACDAAAPGDRLGGRSALCFAAKEKYDIVVGGRKIGGSAQKRTREVIFQHGSIPIADPFGGRSPRFLRLAQTGVSKAATLAELVGTGIGAADLAGTLVDSFEATFGVIAQAGSLSRSEESLAAALAERKYKSDEWNLDRIDPMPVIEEEDEAGAALVGQ